MLQRKATERLPIGAQGQLIDAAVLAGKIGHPINRLTTIRTEILSRSSVGVFAGKHEADGVFAGKHEADGVSSLLELMRKWHINRGIPWAAIWSREVGQTVGGHIHIGTHQSNDHIEPYIDQVANWTGEKRIFLAKHKLGDIGFSEHCGWRVQCCMRRGQSGADVAAYLGKDEPSRTVTGWGVERINASKRTFTHPCHSGYVEGTTRTTYRHGTSRNIAPLTAKGRKALETIGDSERLISDLSWLPY